MFFLFLYECSNITIYQCTNAGTMYRTTAEIDNACTPSRSYAMSLFMCFNASVWLTVDQGISIKSHFTTPVLHIGTQHQSLFTILINFNIALDVCLGELEPVKILV